MVKATGRRLFPSGFLWGAATAGHQVEGNNIHSNWWEWEQQGLVNDGTRSGRACDYWNRFQEDHELLQELGCNIFRLGIEWARIEPRRDRFDADAIDHYRQILQDLQRRGIRVCLTLNHWVVPQWFAAAGSWLAVDALACWERFLLRVIPELAEYVDLWVPLNEPMVPVLAGYLAGYHPPCRRRPLQAARVFRALLEAHAFAYNCIHNLVARPANGSGPPLVGFAGAYQWIEPYHQGGWQVPLERILSRVAEQVSYRAWDESVVSGRVQWPWGMGREIPGLAGSVDFVGVNYYMRMSTRLDAGTLSNVKSGGYHIPPGVETTEMGWQIYPPGFRAVLHQVRRRFQRPIYITENGCCDSGDTQRRRYLLAHLQQLHQALIEGCDIRGYMHWSFIDNFEWREGFAKRFGIIAMDHDDPELRRRQRPSATMFREIIAENGLTPEIVARYTGSGSAHGESPGVCSR
jgi:beta-glucosidase